MSVKYVLTKEEHAALDDTLKALYKADGEGFRLDVTGTDDGKELKEALRKEREASAAAKQKAKDLEDSNAEAERLRLEEKGKYEELWKNSEEAKGKTAKELADLKDKIANAKRTESALAIALKLTKDTGRAELLKKEALPFITHTEDGVKLNSPDGAAWTAEQLGEHLTKSYPFLVDGSQASGGGAGGSGGGATGDLSKLSPTARMTAHRENGGT